MATAVPLTDAQIAPVIQLFLAHFERAPEAEAFDYYEARYAELLAEQPEGPNADADALRALARDVYVNGQASGELPADDDYSNADYVATLYANLLGRPGDEEGLAYWTLALDEGESRENVAVAFLAGAQTGGRDTDYVNNRAEVAREFALPENSGPDVLDDLEYNAQEVLQGVTEDPATIEPALERLHTNDGTDNVLTPGADEFVGGEGDDVYNAPIVDGEQTLGSDDRIDGGGGWNVLRADLIAGAELASPELENIQEVGLNIDGSGETGLDLGRANGVELVSVSAPEEGTDISLANVGGTSEFLVNGAGREAEGATNLNISGANAESIDLSFVDTQGTATVGIAPEVDTINVNPDNSQVALAVVAEAGAVDALEVTLNPIVGEVPEGPLDAVISVDGVRTLDVNASSDVEGATYTLDLSDVTEGETALERLEVSGDRYVDYVLTDAASALREIDAGGNNAGVVIDATAYAPGEGAEPLTIVGTETDDRFVLTDHSVVDGNGGNDIFVVVEGDSASLLGIQGFDEGDRIEFGAGDDAAAVNWVGDFAALDIAPELTDVELDDVRDMVAESIGDNAAGYFEYGGDTYVLSTGEVGSFLNLGTDIELVGAQVEDNALVL